MTSSLQAFVENPVSASPQKRALRAGARLLSPALALAGLVLSLQPAAALDLPAGTKVLIGSFELTVPESDSGNRAAEMPRDEPGTGRKFNPRHLGDRKPAASHGAPLVLAGGPSDPLEAGQDVFSLAVHPSDGASFSGRTFGSGQSHPFTVGAEAGLLSFLSGSAAWRLSDHFGLRGGFNRFAYSLSEDLDDVGYSIKLKMQSEPVLLDVYPWSARSFRLSFGVLLNQNQLSASATPSTNVEIGNTTYTQADVGSLNLSIKQRAVSPYVGMGGNLFYFDSGHQWAFTHEAGVAWTGKPKVGLSASGPLPSADLEIERQKLADDLSKLVLLPIIKFGISYTF